MNKVKGRNKKWKNKKQNLQKKFKQLWENDKIRFLFVSRF